jgi:hypothetical protein
MSIPISRQQCVQCPFSKYATEILERGRPSARVGSDVASTPPHPSLYLSATSRSPNLQVSLMSAGSSKALCHHHCLLPPTKPTMLSPPSVRVVPSRPLPQLSVVRMRRRRPYQWRLGAGAGPFQVISSRAKGNP